MKTQTKTLAVLAFICSGWLILSALAAGIPTTITLFWGPVSNPTGVPYYQEVQQSVGNTNSWVVIAQVPAGATNYTLSVVQDLYFYRIRSVNATNSAWTNVFSSVAQTVWPPLGDGLSIRLGP